MRILKRSIWPPVLASLSLAALAAAGAVTVDRAIATPPAPATVIPVVQEHKHEEDPGFDCRFDGNKQCAVLLDGVWNVISYDEAGQPVHVQPRGL